MNRHRPGSYDFAPALNALVAAALIVTVAAYVLSSLGGFAP